MAKKDELTDILKEIRSDIKQLLGECAKDKGDIEQLKKIRLEKSELIIKPEIFQGKPEPRSYKLYSNVIEALNDFTAAHPQYKTQDIVCAAILEFISKYK